MLSASGRAYRVVVSQPNWLARCLLLSIGAVLTVIVLIIAIPVVLIGAAAFLLLVLIGMGRSMIRSLLGGRAGVVGGGRDGRENVRVIRRDA